MYEDPDKREYIYGFGTRVGILGVVFFWFL